MAKTKAVKRKTRQYNRKAETGLPEGQTLTGMVTSLFLCYMFVVYPLYMHNKYFDITITKYRLFMFGVLCFACLMVPAVCFQLSDVGYKKKKTGRSEKKFCLGKGNLRKWLMPADVFMCLFLAAGFFAWLMADHKREAFTGEMGRRCGLQFILLVFLLYLCLSYGCRLHSYLFPVFSVASVLTYILGILQHMKLDVFRLLEDVAVRQKNSFISTFGNINTFASFICITLALFCGCYLLEQVLWKKILYGCSIFLGFAAVIAANSDIAYAGCGAAVLGLLFIALYQDRLTAFFQIAVLGSAGYTAMACLNRYSHIETRKLTGFNRLALHTEILLPLVGVFLICFVAWNLISKKEKQKKTDVRKKIVFTACAVFVVMLTVFVYGVRNHWDIFTFNDQWGTYRGYIWKRLGELYMDFPLAKKIFGNGNESVRALMYAGYYDEMLQITGTVYDNAHNEYLQYLVTMGLFGLFSYLGLMASVLAACVRYSRKKPELSALGLALCSYLIQAFFNLNQSITTPYVFLLAALIIGMCRYEKRQEMQS